MGHDNLGQGRLQLSQPSKKAPSPFTKSPPPHWPMLTKMQNKENTRFLAFLRLFFVLEWTKK